MVTLHLLIPIRYHQLLVLMNTIFPTIGIKGNNVQLKTFHCIHVHNPNSTNITYKHCYQIDCVKYRDQSWVLDYRSKTWNQRMNQDFLLEQLIFHTSYTGTLKENSSVNSKTHIFDTSKLPVKQLLCLPYKLIYLLLPLRASIKNYNALLS